MKQNYKTTLELNIAEFLAEYFDDKTGFSYGSFWQAINLDVISVYTDRKSKSDSSFYYEYGLLKAEEEMEAEHNITETHQDNTWCYTIHYINAEEPQVSYFFYTKTRIMAFIQHEEETMNLAAEMQNIAQQKPVLCLESHTLLFRRALGEMMESYSHGYYSDEDLQREYCPDNSEVAIDWMHYKFGCSDEYEADYCVGCSALETNVGYAIDAAWNWLHAGFVNNFISKDTKTNLLRLNW